MKKNESGVERVECNIAGFIHGTEVKAPRGEGRTKRLGKKFSIHNCCRQFKNIYRYRARMSEREASRVETRARNTQGHLSSKRETADTTRRLAGWPRTPPRRPGTPLSPPGTPLSPPPAPARGPRAPTSLARDAERVR